MPKRNEIFLSAAGICFSLSALVVGVMCVSKCKATDNFSPLSRFVFPITTEALRRKILIYHLGSQQGGLFMAVSSVAFVPLPSALRQ